MFSFSPDRKTKIIATLGPASATPEVLLDVLRCGADLIRLNASHNADPKIVKEQVALIRHCAQTLEKSVGIFLDLQGPKIRVGKFAEQKIELQTGQTFVLTTDTVLGDENRASVTYAGFADDVEVGQPLYIDDGKVQLVIREKKGNDVICEVDRGGIVSNSKGINLPLTHIKMSALTEKDRKDVKLAVEHELDYVALSFVSTADDVTELREYLKNLGSSDIQIISKIERQFAIDNILPIIKASDAIMVARGDLGVEIGVAHVPKIQKMIIRESNKRLKPVIVATQMLESMIYSEMATRAEVSDVANAIYDRCDAVMLSGETAMGINPSNVIKTMVSICVATDKHMVDIKLDHGGLETYPLMHTPATSFCKAADQIAEENEAKVIMAFTSSGNTPLIASKLNPAIPIIAPTDSEKICQRMSLYRGVTPLLLTKKYSEIHRWTDMIALSVKHAKQAEIVHPGDRVVVTAGIPIGQSNGINSIRMVTVH
jgi:pyruvate kinase